MKRIIIVDSNVLWSTAYRATSDIGQFLLVSDPSQLVFYTPEYLKVEVDKHFSKIVTFSGQSAEEVRTVLEAAYRKITFISDAQIPFEHFITAIRLVRDIDMNDVVFVALAEYLDAVLWTGDDKLYRGLRDRGFDKVINFQELKELVRR